MRRTDTLKSALLALALGLTTVTASAQPDLDEGGFTPSFTDDDIFTYVEAEIDYTSKADGQLRWDIESWIGGDYSKLWLGTHGDSEDGDVAEARFQILYGRYLAPFWDWRAGIRHDVEPESLSYAVLGIKGLAPYRFETDANLYLSEDGDLSIGLEAEYDALLTQRLVAQPYVDLELFAQDVPELGKGSGLTELAAGLRVRYEIRREFAPYVDLGYSKTFGETADLARAAGEDTSDFVVRAGLRVWY